MKRCQTLRESRSVKIHSGNGSVKPQAPTNKAIKVAFPVERKRASMPLPSRARANQAHAFTVNKAAQKTFTRVLRVQIHNTARVLLKPQIARAQRPQSDGANHQHTQIGGRYSTGIPY